MKSRIVNKKKNSFADNHPIWFFLLFLVGICIFTFFENSSSTIRIRKNLVYKLLCALVFSVFFLYFTWFSKHKPDKKAEQIVISLFSVSQFLAISPIPDRIYYLFQFTVSSLFTYIALKHFASDKKYHEVTVVAFALSALTCFMTIKDYTYLKNSYGFHFWQFGIVGSIIITGIYLYLFYIKKDIKLETDTKFERISAIFLVTVGSLIVFTLSINNFNYALDFSKPSYYQCVIKDKQIDSGYRGGTDYIFSADIHGEEKDFYVSKSEYFSKAPGDKFSVELYNGAFGQKYFTYKYE